MVVAAVVSLYLQVHFGWTSDSNENPYQFAYLMLTTVGITTAAWLLVTFVTPPEPRERLVEFYRRVRPAGPGWASIAAEAGDVGEASESLAMQFYNWVLGCVMIYATLFGIGKLIFKEWTAGAIYVAVATIAAALISRSLMSANWRGPEK